MKKVIVLGASNSKTSINKQLAIYAGSLLENVAVKILDLNDYQLPIYGMDLENEAGIHPEAEKFNNDLQEADAYIVSFAEHNGTYTVAFKNAYDWASRINAKVWGDKPFLALATSPGIRGGASVLQAAVDRFPFMGAQLIGSFSLPSFYDNFNEGRLINTEWDEKLRKEIDGLQQALN
ncbi:NADPH-dependent FMN reductase [Ochrovirga pacifica]|uniref:NADPH-dependent FMN reductase n=1 Tax=Ochrovirga pacifica TaxID=1042376 RepID=UPI000255A020|nr:NAD(P)H-dependent oxidoreductase [Ochrovirga pacifica]